MSERKRRQCSKNNGNYEETKHFSKGRLEMGHFSGNSRKVRACAAFLSAVLLLVSVPHSLMRAEAADGDVGADIMLVYADLQTRKTQDMSINTRDTDYKQQQLPSETIYLAKNEREGFQIYYREKKANRAISVTVSDFVNEAGETLPHEVFREEFFTPAGVSGAYFADALLPYQGENMDTILNQNQAVYIELHSKMDQKPGKYTSTVTVLDNGGKVLYSKPVTAIVWNFALPENRYADAVLGLYNNQSSYGDMYRILRANGIGNPDEDPAAKADAVKLLDNYQEYLLSHGISTYEIPRWLVDDDPKKAQLTMADPRRNTFTIPIRSSDFDVAANKLSTKAEAVLNTYKTLAWNDPDMKDYIRDKMYIHLWDEPNWSADPKTKDTMMKMGPIMTKLLPGYHAAVPFSVYQINGELSDLREVADIMCPTNDSYRPWGWSTDDPNTPYVQELIDSTMKDPTRKDAWFRTWRYPTESQFGNTYLYTWDTFSQGNHRRILYWQQYALNGSGKGGILHWNCAYWPYENIFETKTLPDDHGAAQGNGDGVLLYPGLQAGYDRFQPIGSLRLKQLSDGLDDYDYLKLSEEFVSPEFADTQLKSILYGLKTNIRNIFWKEEGWAAWSCGGLQYVRKVMGNAIEKAVNEGKGHNFGAWKLVVKPDDNYSGLEIRKCNCGATESRRTPEEKPEHIHKGTHHDEVKATCIRKGSVGYWTCSDEKCNGKYYSDEACRTEITDIETSIDTNNHTGGTEVRNAKEATCCAEGYSGDICCVDCGTVITNGSAVAATGKHSADADWKTDADSHWQVCATPDCGIKMNQAGHVFRWIVDKPATEDSTGLQHEECESCHYKRSLNTVIPKQTQTTNTISGTIISYGNADAKVMVQLYKEDGKTLIDTKPDCISSYSFTNVAQGTYLIRVAKTKHCPRDYMITVGNEAVTRDVEIWLYGDVNGKDGVNAQDATQINRYIANMSSVFNSGDADIQAYRKKVADVNGEGGVNAQDATQINRYCANMKSVFDQLP